MKQLNYIVLALGLSFGLVNTALADNVEKGLQIVKQLDDSDRGWGDQVAELQMTLSNKQGQSSERKLTMKSLEVDGDGDKSLSVFSQPRDVAGTAFLSYSHTREADQQWLYLPALKRVKRISSANKSGPFLGSEFAFEDLSSFEVDKYTYEYLRDEKLGGRNAQVIKFVPQYESSGYQYQLVWIDPERHVMVRVDYFDRKGAALKTLYFNDYKQYLDKYWRAQEFYVVNHQTGKSTKLTWSNYQFKSGLSEADFNQNALKRAK